MGAVASSFARASKDVPRSLLGYDAGEDDGKGKGREKDAEELKKVAAWLSDWHLLAYLDETGIFDPVCCDLGSWLGAEADLASRFPLPLPLLMLDSLLYLLLSCYLALTPQTEGHPSNGSSRLAKGYDRSPRAAA